MPIQRNGSVPGAFGAKDTQATGTTFGESSQPIKKPGRAPGTFGTDFDESEEEDEGRPLSPQLPVQPPRKGGRGRRVTIQVPTPEDGAGEGGDGAQVRYPELRDFAAGDHPFSSSRRISSTRYSFVEDDLEIGHRYEEEEGEIAEYLCLYHSRKDGDIDKHNLVVQVSSVQEFAKSMGENAPDWYAVLNKYTDLQDTMSQDIHNAAAMLEQAEGAYTEVAQAKAEVDEQIETLRYNFTEKHTAQTKELEGANATIEQARTGIKRVRGKRDELSQKLQEAENTIKEMQKALDKKDSRRKKENKRKQQHKQKKRWERTDFDLSGPSDNSSDSSSSSEDTGDERRSRAPSPDRRRHGRKNTPITEFTDRDTPDDHDPRYPHIATYSGRADEDLEQWIATAETKFRRSHKNYPDEWSKVEYLRGHCQSAAYETVKSRALPQSKHRYKHRQELYDDLTENFGVPDKAKSALDRIFSGKVKQTEHEKVGAWISRFNVLAIEAHLDSTSKIFLALANLNAKYKTAATQNAKPNESWAEFVARMRAVEQNTAAAYGGSNALSRRNDNRSVEKKEEDKKKSKKGNSGRDKDDEYGLYRPKEQFERIMQKKVCAKCFKADHKSNDPNPPCKDKKKTPFSVFETLFVVNEEDDEETLKDQS